ncbi:hybrid sensor histidine kinase/response regulator [Rugamonas sp.]|uniref:hybrid sensor histidine kinase/response regulator n=1 Tax=Rugamonas sp. TaxID=1926287 RepID=UPI0025F754B1|nr:hybrid sensor histidine kinase/response regulator [Rugamonas sp.]
MHSDTDLPQAPSPEQPVNDLHRHDIDELRAVIVELLQQVEFLQRNQTRQESQLSQSREAKQNLVLAAFGAQDLQSSTEAAIVRQTEFLSMLAHELRDPLQPIALANELLGKLAVGGPEVLRYQRIIGRQVAHLARLVDDLFDASRVSGGAISIQKPPLTLAAIIEAGIKTSRPFVDARCQRFELDLPAQPVPLSGDPVRLAQVFSNLFINASKFSPENESIAISAVVLTGAVCVAVRDHGIGVEADQQPLIFDLFTQGRRSADRAQGGLGIGLSLARSIVEMHGGTISVASAGIGLGSEFTVRLPLASTAAAPPPTVATASPPTAIARRGRRLRILLVEDNMDANETLCQLLERAHHVVTQRFDGVTALASAAVQPYDVVICDIGLPGMDGYTLVEKIRSAAQWDMPRFIATSGYSEAYDQQRATRIGFDHYFVKPLAIDELLALIDRLEPAAARHTHHRP